MLLYERQTLKEGRKLLLGSTEYNIVKVIGKGGSCIVYEAVYADNIGKKHTVRIKECFPHGLRIARNITGALSVDENDRNEFKNRKVRFIQAYENNVNFRELCGITNSVPEASNIYRQNNTVYTVVSTSEGKVYGSYKSKNLKEIFTIAKTLTGLIGRYHEQNLLYLDIKPDNIYILPETKQQIILFDFDSVMQTPITEDEAADMSCSSGFAAPELMMGKLNKIGKHTDIYAIGAVVFYKIFGRAPSAHDKMSACVYDFSSIQFADENYNPRLYTRLETFFRKTITASPVNRFQSTEEMQGILEELENLSDLDSMYLHSTMPPAPKFSFVGRREETEELAEAVRSHGKVFVTGMGGIGKTEIVKKYLQEKKDDYNTVVFALYEESLKETVCGECFDVNNLIRGENESDDEFYSRKYHFLKELDENDIIVIDNFDVFDDEKLDDFLNLRCKVIFTSRNSCFRDYGYCEVEIEEIGSLRELCEIFEIYNEGAYSPMDVKAIEDLILFVESHTMTVELLAKYIRVSGEAPIKVLKKMQESAKGVTNISQARVLMEKDRRRSSNSVNRYLLTLFDIFKFSAREKELLTTLSVFGSVRIKKELFLNIYRDEYAADTVRALAYAGWIEEDESSGKISLHQIILDLIYNELGHDTSVCRVGVNGMIEYMRMSNYDAVLSVNRKRLAKAFCKRLQGDDLLKALFNIAYCGFVQYDERLTAETEEISNNCDSMDAAVIHARNICIQTAHLYECYCFTDFEKTEEYIRDLYEKLLRLEAAFFRKFANFAGGEDKFEEIASDDIVNCFCELADVIDKLTGKICTECMEIYPPQFNEIESLYRNAEGLLKYAAYLAENAKKRKYIQENKGANL